MDVRQATANDAPAIRRVAERSWEHDYPEIMSRETISDGVEQWYDVDQIRTELDREDTEILVAEVDGDVVGFSHAVREEDDAEEGDILRLYVDPDHRRSGVGSLLVERTRTELFRAGVDRIRAMVLAENELGNAFYHNHGFDRVDDAETDVGGESRRENVYVSSRG